MYKPDVQIHKAWKPFFATETAKPYFLKLQTEIALKRKVEAVYPAAQHTFRAFQRLNPNSVKIAILGQDPYHANGQAHGLAFSVPKGTKAPPSLRNIFREAQNDTGGSIPDDGNLEFWEQQGVLLLNTILTVTEGKPLSHKNLGWEHFTAAAMQYLDTFRQPMVFLLWGDKAILWEKYITARNDRLILKTAHPSPLSAYRGFFGCGHFGAANRFLKSHGAGPVLWLPLTDSSSAGG